MNLFKRDIALGAVTSLQLSHASLKLSFLLAKSRHWENQPRVPRGNPDGGQWTDGGGSSGGSNSSGSTFGAGNSSQFTIPNPDIGTNIDDDIFADESTKIDLVQNQREFNYRTYSLAEDEGRGAGVYKAHTISEHVGKSDKYLKERVRKMAQTNSATRNNKIIKTDRLRGRAKLVAQGINWLANLGRSTPKHRVYQASSFKSLESANNIVREAFRRNLDQLDAFRIGKLGIGELIINEHFSYDVGKISYAKLRRNPKLISARSVRIIIRRDASSPKGFRVHTAYPVR